MSDSTRELSGDLLVQGRDLLDLAHVFEFSKQSWRPSDDYEQYSSPYAERARSLLVASLVRKATSNSPLHNRQVA
jgi:hypothetical protein